MPGFVRFRHFDKFRDADRLVLPKLLVRVDIFCYAIGLKTRGELQFVPTFQIREHKKAGRNQHEGGSSNGDAKTGDKPFQPLARGFHSAPGTIAASPNAALPAGVAMNVRNPAASRLILLGATTYSVLA